MDCTIVTTTVPQQKRQTAYKVWISTLLQGTYTPKSGEWEPNYVQCGDKQISRVNVLATIISKEASEQFASITVDDGSGTIQVRAFRDDAGSFNNVNVGDLITIIGRPRQFQTTLYLVSEIVRKMDNPKWLEVRKLELTKEWGAPQATTISQPQTLPTTSPQPVQETSTEKNRQVLLNLAEKAGDDGIDVDALIKSSGLAEQEAEKIMDELLQEGEIYMPRPGHVKIV